MNELPDRDAAMRTLFQRQVRATVMLFVRVVGLSIVTTILKIQMPWLRPYSALLDALSGVLALWPFWTAVGRNWQWRMELGKAYCDAGRFTDAVAVLEALDGVQGRLFDAQGSGAAILAKAREAVK